jgi:hypothetical protein
LASLSPSGLLSAVAAALVLIGPPQPPYRILFIGNSLTYSNDLPAMVCALARGEGVKSECESVTKPDYSLEDHWHERDARRAIARGWNAVVLQQGPSALAESRVLLIDFTRRFDGEIRKSGARTALYMVWPSRSRNGDFDGVSQSYAAAAGAVGGLLLPVGDAWRDAWRIDPSLALYSNDGLHPSPTGSALAAIVIYRQIFDKPPVNVRFRGIDPALTATLVTAADQAVRRLQQ